MRMIHFKIIIVDHSPEPSSLKFSLKSVHNNLMGWIKSFPCMLPTIDTVGSKTIILLTAGTNGRILEHPMERCLLTTHLSPLGALPCGRQNARPTFTAGGAAEVGPALAGAGTIP